MSESKEPQRLQEPQRIDYILRFLFRHLKRGILYTIRIFNIKDGTDVEGTIASISNGIQVKGYNLWLLIASALIASVGLDLNSPAVIIGAMLISPLMSPILGIGLAIGTTDRTMLYNANRNFFIAALISFVTSAVYFLITPLGQPQPEMYARIEPTLLDVGVAFFGGVAGIVAGSRSEKNKRLTGRCNCNRIDASSMYIRVRVCNRKVRFFLWRILLVFPQRRVYQSFHVLCCPVIEISSCQLYGPST